MLPRLADEIVKIEPLRPGHLGQPLLEGILLISLLLLEQAVDLIAHLEKLGVRVIAQVEGAGQDQLR